MTEWADVHFVYGNPHVQFCKSVSGPAKTVGVFEKYTNKSMVQQLKKAKKGAFYHAGKPGGCDARYTGCGTYLSEFQGERITITSCFKRLNSKVETGSETLNLL